MAVSDGESVTVVKDMGLVMTVFDERTVSALPGDLAIGHTRYSTTGRSEWRNAQPVYRSMGRSGFALGHNGNLTNTAELASRSGMLPGVVASDSDLIAEVVAAAWGRGPGGHDADTGTAAEVDSAAPNGHGNGNGNGNGYGTGTLAGTDSGAGLEPSDAALLEEALRAVLPSVEGAYLSLIHI